MALNSASWCSKDVCLSAKSFSVNNEMPCNKSFLRRENLKTFSIKKSQKMMQSQNIMQQKNQQAE